jgi:aminoglycoside phosphotransferase (APT) family kinase protein
MTEMHLGASSPDSASTLPSEACPVRAGQELDGTSLTCYLRAQLTDVEGDMSVLQFPRGWANLTYLVQFGEHKLVVRRPPFGALAPGAHDMRREYKTLSRLWRHFDRAPRALLFCDDDSVIGSHFVVMEYREGVVIDGEIPPSMAGHTDVSRRVGMAVIDALAELHRLDPSAVDLADLGRPDGFLARQLAGWRRRWSLAAPEGAVPLMEDAGVKLEASIPHSPRSSILHNDYKLDNCQFDPARPDRVKSIFDWDMATLGDPLVDLGTLINYWPDPSDTDDSGPIVSAGMGSIGLPGRPEMIERYTAQTGLDGSEVHWYEAFACWKRAVIMQQLYARYLEGDSADDRMAAQAAWIPALARRAVTILG